MAQVDEATGGKIKVISLYASAMVCLNHAYAVGGTYAEDAGRPFAWANHFVEDFAKFGLARISTPFFFMLSAWLLFGRLRGSLTAWPGEATKRARTLLVPYAFWAVWSFALMVALQTFVPGAVSEGRGRILDYPWPRLAELLLWNQVAHPLWFLRDLMLLVAAAPLVWLAMRWKPVAWTVLAVLLGVWFQWFDVRETRAVLFFCLGAYCAIHRPTLVARGAWERLAALAAWFGLITWSTLRIMADGHEQPVLYNTAILVGLAVFWTADPLAARLYARPAVRWCSAFTFLIYVAHEPLTTLTRHTLERVLAPEHQLAVLGIFFATAALVIGGIILGGATLRALAPAVYAMITGGRGLGRRRPAATPVVAPAAAAGPV